MITSLTERGARGALAEERGAEQAVGEQPPMSARPTDDLFRYMKAFKDSVEHTANCPACQGETPCADGAPIHERFARLQDAYTARQNQQR